MTRSLVCSGTGDHAADFLLDDAHVLAQGLVELGVAHQQGRFFLEHAVANGGGDLEAFATGRAHVELVAVERHQDAAPGHDGFRRKIHDQRKQFRQGPVAGQLASGADQGPHLRAALHHTVVLLRSSTCGPRTPSRLATTVVALFENCSLFSTNMTVFWLARPAPANSMVRCPAETRSPGTNGIGFFDADAVQQRSVLAAQILHGPLAVAADDGQMLARKSDIVGVTELIRAGAAERDAVAIQGYGGGLAVQVADDQFARGNFGRWPSRS